MSERRKIGSAEPYFVSPEKLEEIEGITRKVEERILEQNSKKSSDPDKS